MHAFLFIGEKKQVESAISNFQETVGGEVINHNIQKISDVRSLVDLIKLGRARPLIVRMADINKATLEAQNALLKSLEEPPTNTSFVLTSQSEAGILPTILSRVYTTYCTVNEKREITQGADFVNAPLITKIAQIEKVKERSEAIKLVKDIINFYHGTITTGNFNSKIYKHLTLTSSALSSLQKNGNIYLHLTNLAIKLSSTHLQKG